MKPHPLSVSAPIDAPSAVPGDSPLDALSAPPASEAPGALDRIRIVLVSTSHPGNIGAAARALKTMGLSRLALVTPRYDDALSDADALAMATGAADVLAATTIHPTLSSALQGCVWAVAMTARNRFYSPPEMTPRVAAQRAVQLATDGGDVAFVFGSERYGLDNEDVLTCQACGIIPTSATYSSLNLAQAVQIAAYECQLASLDAAPAHQASVGEPAVARLATIEEREQLFTHLQEALIAIDFLDPGNPKKLMQRLRRVFSRNDLEHEEVNILRGICSGILSTRK